MQVQKGGSYTNMRADLDLVLEDEHHILATEQKAYKARTRKFSLETNRRRKALEERRRTEDIREQKLREDILQQRRHKVQDVTERFQRAHLPPSQRKRQGPTLHCTPSSSASRRATPHLEEALNQIQGSSSSSALQSTFFRSPTSNRSYASSPSSTGGSAGSRYQRQLSAAVAYAKLMQEKSGATLKNSQLLFHNELQETQRLLEERQNNSLQDFQREVGQVGQSESLSSLDSLENEGPLHQPAGSLGFMSCSSSENSKVPNVTRPQSPQKHFNSSDDLRRQRNGAITGSCPSTQDTEEPGEYDKTTQATGEPITESQKPAPAPSHQSTFTQRGIIGNIVHLQHQTKIDPPNCVCQKFPASSHPATSTKGGMIGNVVYPTHLREAEKAPVGMPCKAWESPDTTSPEFSWTQGDVYGQMRSQVDRFINQPEATRVVMPSSHCGDREVSCYSSEDPSAFPSAMSQKSPDPEASVTKSIERMSHLHKIHLACNAKTSCDNDADCETRSTQTKPLGSSDLTTRSTQVKDNRGHEHEVPSTLALASTSISASIADSTKSIKGILKKESKYATTCHAKLTSPAGCVIANHFSVSVKDSVEVVKQRERDTEGRKGMKKKLRWFDEVCFHEEEDESKPLQDVFRQQTQGQGKPSALPQGETISEVNPEDPVQASGLLKTTPAPQVVTPMTPETPVGHHLTKQAWEYGRGPERERSEEARLEKGVPRRGRPRGPRRVRSAKARLGLTPPRTRKGVAMRPQSASEASQPYGRVGPLAEQRDVPEGYTLPPDNSVLTTTGEVAFDPVSPSCTLSTYGTISKATYAMGNGQQDALGAASRRGPLYIEHGLHLAQTPTDEEISQLWHGVRSALAPKNGDPRTLAAYNGLLSGLSQARANLSHVTIDGGSLMSGIKAVTRMGGFFVTTSNATKSTVRRKQSADGNGTKHRALLEQRRVTSGSAMRKPPVPSQTTVQISPLGSKADQIAGVALQDEVTESTAQFLLAENLAETSATDADILAAMEMAHRQVQQQPGPQQRPQPPGTSVSALSLEGAEDCCYLWTAWITGCSVCRRLQQEMPPFPVSCRSPLLPTCRPG
ncbi:hypothetical protein SKAU_G00327070 [Synaphobranchus kaupii]|uniref:Centrosomal protein of 126 kDa n=1 Tax=Synaphobranchus kaupii TaxID=118154 RepID=A0A9Q1IKH0_SYNKA|nr:hypothetical protein SKAU_G00327070 [Synaphobranchus kaupii]